MGNLEHFRKFESFEIPGLIDFWEFLNLEIFEILENPDLIDIWDFENFENFVIFEMFENSGLIDFWVLKIWKVLNILAYSISENLKTLKSLKILT